nr:ADM_HP1_G0032940.mRNA.1.CDS.1 [Saccharomyces cerevisiae]
MLPNHPNFIGMKKKSSETFHLEDCIFPPPIIDFSDANFEDCFQRELNKIVGTPAFIAPELCHLGNSKRDFVTDGFKLDIWSLGVTLYCLLYNELPFFGENEFETYHKIIEVSLSSKINGNTLNDLVIKRLLEKDVTLRISIQDLVKVLSRDQPIDSRNHSQTSSSSVNPVRNESPVRRFW